MKLAKSLLLGSAAGLFAVAGAQAADLPVRKAAPVEYVRVCTAYGAGFFYIPGTDTCLRISGFIRAEYTYYEPSNRYEDATGFGARGRINFDARTATEFGLLRTFVRFEERTRTGSYGGVGPYASTSSFSLDKGFIQFGGLTAGRVQSLYDFYAHDIEYIAATIGSDQSTQTLAYTAQFGGGFSATIAIEDPTVRQQKVGPFATFAAPTGFIAPIGFATAGTRMPDVVGVLRADQAWGSAQLSAAAHQIRATNLVGLPVPGFGTVYDTPDTDYGFAIQGGVKVNLPMLAPGDALWLQAAYAQGAPSYSGFDYLGFTGTATGRTVGRLRNIFIPVTDAYVNPFNGDLEKSESWSVQGAFLHYWLPTLRQGVFGSYGQIRYSGPSAFINPTTGIVNGFPDANTWNIGSNLIWSPVKDLDLGVEVVYQKINLDHGIAPYVSTGSFAGTGFAAGLPATYGLKNEDAWSGKIRIERDF